MLERRCRSCKRNCSRCGQRSSRCKSRRNMPKKKGNRSKIFNGGVKVSQNRGRSVGFSWLGLKELCWGLLRRLSENYLRILNMSLSRGGVKKCTLNDHIECSYMFDRTRSYDSVGSVGIQTWQILGSLGMLGSEAPRFC